MPNNNDDAALRTKYANDLKTLVQCPVCLEIPVGPVPMCSSGHHTCQVCRERLQECPVCRGRLMNRIRNFAVETLSSILNGILPLLLPPEPEPQLIKCRIGLCQTRLRRRQLYRHIYSSHQRSLVRLTLGSHCNFNLEYDYSKLYTWALRADDSSVFFFISHIDDRGVLLVELEVASNVEKYCHRRYEYEMSLHVPYCKEVALNTVKGTLCVDDKSVPLHPFSKGCFRYYYAEKGKRQCVSLLKENCGLPFRLSLVIRPQLL